MNVVNKEEDYHSKLIALIEKGTHNLEYYEQGDSFIVVAQDIGSFTLRSTLSRKTHTSIGKEQANNKPRFRLLYKNEYKKASAIK